MLTSQDPSFSLAAELYKQSREIRRDHTRMAQDKRILRKWVEAFAEHEGIRPSFAFECIVENKRGELAIAYPGSVLPHLHIVEKAKSMYHVFEGIDPEAEPWKTLLDHVDEDPLAIVACQVKEGSHYVITMVPPPPITDQFKMGKLQSQFVGVIRVCSSGTDAIWVCPLTTYVSLYCKKCEREDE